MSLATADKLAVIQRVALENQGNADGDRVLWSRHATARLVDYDLVRSDVEKALQTCTMIEDYSTLHRPLPDCLILGILPDQRPVHVVAAVDIENDRIFVVTVYLPSQERWQDDWKTRKS